VSESSSSLAPASIPFFNNARRIIEEHNQHVAEDLRLDIDVFLRRLQAKGGTTPERLSRMSHEDILDCFVVPAGVPGPILLAREIAGQFRGSKPTGSESPQRLRPVTAARASIMNDRELLEAFDPRNPDSPVAERLKVRSKGRPCLVFRKDGTVHVEYSEAMLAETHRGFPEILRRAFGGVLHKLYRVGELPDDFAEENPLFPGEPLFSDGTCGRTSVSWAHVPLETRQLLRFAVETIDLRPEPDRIQDLFAGPLRATESGPATSHNDLRVRFPNAAFRFDERERLGTLPTLRMSLHPAGGKGNPFQGGRRV
jgi:hypothetical protein